MNLLTLAVVIVSGLGESLTRAFSDLGHVPQCLVAYPEKELCLSLMHVYVKFVIAIAISVAHMPLTH